MIINSEHRLATVLTATRELRDRAGTVPADDFYADKIAAVWARAQGSPAHAGLGDFSPGAFAALAPTRKEQLKGDPWSFVAASIDDGVKYYETTGTTGTATPTPRLVDDVIWNTVSVAQAWHDLLRADDRVLSLLPSDIVPVGDLVAAVCEHLDLLHARAYPFATGISDWDRLASLWTAMRPTALFLAPGVALQLTRLFKQRGLLAELSASVRTIMLLGEVSVPAMRSRLGRWWGATAFNASYGSTETGTLAAACRNDRLHLLTAANYCELLTPAGLTGVRGPATGRLVVTPLNLHARPLLRYDTGDDVVVATDCPCGTATPDVTVLGRATDGVRVRDTTLTPHVVEEIVYDRTGSTGYLLEAAPDRIRLLLERDVDADRAAEPDQAAAVRHAFHLQTGLADVEVLFLNSLPTVTKSGGSQKSWKRSNIRILEATP
jgi:phenylacetate-CoA ligase